MKILSVKNPKYTSRLVMDDGTKILIPKPYVWGAFEKAHVDDIFDNPELLEVEE